MLACELGISSQVRFSGQRSRSLLRWYYIAANVFLTTPWYEPFGIIFCRKPGPGLPSQPGTPHPGKALLELIAQAALAPGVQIDWLCGGQIRIK